MPCAGQVGPGGRDLLQYPVTVVGVLGLWRFIPGATLRGARETDITGSVKPREQRSTERNMKWRWWAREGNKKRDRRIPRQGGDQGRDRSKIIQIIQTKNRS